MKVQININMETGIYESSITENENSTTQEILICTGLIEKVKQELLDYLEPDVEYQQ